MATARAGGNPRPAWERGQRLSARGERWTLIDVQSGVDCQALHLDAETAPNRPLTLLFPFDRFERLPARQAPRIVRLPLWTRHLSRLAALTRPAGGLEAAASTRIDLLGYQLEPALAVLRHGATRVLIADAVGLGKTIQAGIIVAELVAQTPALRALVLVPAGLREQWAQELERLFDLPTVRADAAWLRAITSDRPSHVNPWCLPGIYLASQDFAKRPEVLRPLEEVSWDILIVDEAHASSSRTDRRAAAHAIASRATRVVLLTATPHADDVMEFRSLCTLGSIDPGEPSIVLFRRSRRDAGDFRARRSALLSVRPTVAELRMHELLEQYTVAVWRESGARGDDLARLATVVLRKRALSSAASLALSVRRRMALLAGREAPACEQLRLPLADEDPLDDGEHAALGAPGLAHASREQRWLAAIAEAARRASRAESKVRFIRRLLNRIHEPAIVFTEYRDTLQRLGAALATRDRPLLLLHGGMSPSERSLVQRAFNEGEALLLATDAAAEGLNLHARCRVIVHYELPWSTSRLEQRAGRVDRLGQSRRVHELGLVAATTAERLVLAPLMRRASRARPFTGEAPGLAADLTESRVAEVVIGGAPAASLEREAPTAHYLAVTRTLPLRDEAEEEARRLRTRRAHLLNRAVAAPAQLSRPLVSSMVRRHSALRRGLILIYSITLTSPAGLSVHAQAVAFDVEFLNGRWVKVPLRALRRQVQPFASPGHPVVARAITRAVEKALDVASPIHARVENSVRQRRLLMDSVRTAAARRLVQASLFERRGTGARLDEAILTVMPADHPAPSVHVLGVDVTLLAALRIVDR